MLSGSGFPRRRNAGQRLQEMGSRYRRVPGGGRAVYVEVNASGACTAARVAVSVSSPDRKRAVSAEKRLSARAQGSRRYRRSLSGRGSGTRRASRYVAASPDYRALIRSSAASESPAFQRATVGNNPANDEGVNSSNPSRSRSTASGTTNRCDPMLLVISCAIPSGSRARMSAARSKACARLHRALDGEAVSPACASRGARPTAAPLPPSRVCAERRASRLAKGLHCTPALQWRVLQRRLLMKPPNF